MTGASDGGDNHPGCPERADSSGERHRATRGTEGKKPRRPQVRPQHNLRHLYNGWITRNDIEVHSHKPLLYTATLAHNGQFGMLQLFHASFPAGPDAIVDRLALRLGRDVARLADVRVGFHPAAPLVVALVPNPIARVIRQFEIRHSPESVKRFIVDIRHNVRL